MTKKIKNITKIFLFFLFLIASALILSEKNISLALEAPYKPSEQRTSTSGGSAYTPMEEIPGQGKPTDFYSYINAIYKFGIGAVGICAMLMIIVGGYMYMTAAGNNSSMEKAKTVITDAIIGLILAMASYLILYFINPDLVKIKRLQPMATGTPSSPGETPGGGSCKPDTSNGCTVEILKPYFGDNATKASSICNVESGGLSIPSTVDKCQPGGEAVSWGLFQINISSNKIGGYNCPDAFDKPYTAKNHSCVIKNKALYEKCVQAAKNPTTNIKKAVELSKKGTSWGAWGANSKCKF